MSINLENEILNQMGRDFAQEIDNNIMIDLYENGGWIKIMLPKFNDRYHAVDIQEWCDDNIAEHEYANFGSTFVFKNSKDAVWFTLIWMNT